MEITPDMIQINTLWNHSEVKDFYYIKGYDVYNVVTGTKKAVTYTPNAGVKYPYVTLERKGGGNKKCLMHHLVALSMIKNEPYEVIEHLDDVKTNYHVSNLLFSNHKSNHHRAVKNGVLKYKIGEIYELQLLNGTTYRGTMRELSEKSGIPRMTLYDHVYHKHNYVNSPLIGRFRNIKSVTRITGQQTIEKNPDA